MKIEILNARQEDKGITWLKNVYPLYLHDLSQFDGGHYTLDETGIWQPDRLPVWFSDENALPLILSSGGRWVGFAFVGCKPFPYISSDVDFRMSEFFILRSFRREGIGRKAAAAIFKQYPGKWEVIQLPLNASAVLFWRSVISDFTNGSFDQTTLKGCTRQVFTTVIRQLGEAAP